MSNDAEDKFDEEHGLEERGSAKESRMEGAMTFCPQGCNNVSRQVRTDI